MIVNTAHEAFPCIHLLYRQPESRTYRLQVFDITQAGTQSKASRGACSAHLAGKQVPKVFKIYNKY